VSDGAKLPTWSLCSLGNDPSNIQERFQPLTEIPSLATNIIVSSMLILGGSATVTDLTGMSTIAVCRLITIFFVPLTILSAVGLFSHSIWCRHLRSCWGNALHTSLRLVSVTIA